MPFLKVAKKSSDNLIKECVVKVVNAANQSNPKLLFTSLISTNAYTLNQSVIRIIIRGLLFVIIFYDTIDSFIDKSTRCSLYRE